MAAGGHFGSPICAQNNRVLSLCVINGYAKYEVDRWIYDKVRDATSFLSIFMQIGLQGRGGGDGGAIKNIIPPTFSNFGDILFDMSDRLPDIASLAQYFTIL